jgi:hypothetical protein
MIEDYNLKNKVYSNANDIFNYEFDITWMNMPEHQGNRHYTLLPVERAEDDSTVEYYFNKDGFRSEEFTDQHNPGKHILFAGCSQTEGVGSPLDTVWSKMLHDKLQLNNLTDGFYSIAKGGYGWQKIIANFMAYSKKYGFPDYFFVLMPNITRHFIWHNNDYLYIQRYKDDGNVNEPEPKSVVDDQPATIEDYYKEFLNFSLGWKIFIEYCKQNNVKVLWSTWEYSDNHNIKLFNQHKDFFAMNHEEYMEMIKNKRPDGILEKYDIKRRDGHAGVLSHEYWLQSFIKEIKRFGIEIN